MTQRVQECGASTTSHLLDADDFLVAEIEARTQDDDSFWSLPNRDPRDSGHAFFQYPAMMVPAVQRNLINIVKSAQPNIGNMFDPYVGAGTTLTAGIHHGLDCYGQDINPLSILLSYVKTGPFYKSITDRSKRIVRIARSDTSTEISTTFPNLNKWFRTDVAAELSRLRRAILKEERLWARRFMWINLAETIRLTSNDRTTTYKLHARPAEEIAERCVSPLETFAVLIEKNLEDLKEYRDSLNEAGYLKNGRFTGHVNIALQDTAENVILPCNGRGRYDLLITSPPYGDNTSTITYGEHSYLPLQWIDLQDIDPGADKSFLRTTQEIDRRSLGGHRSRALEEQIARLSLKSNTLADTFQKLAGKPRDRSSRVAAFYQDFIVALDRIVESLAENAYMIWTVGNRRVGGIEIANDEILIELLRTRSVKFVTRVERWIHNKRMPHNNQIAQMMRSEGVLIFRKVVNMGQTESNGE